GSVVVRTQSIKVDGVSARVTQAAQLTADVPASVGNVDVEAFILNLPERFVEVVGKVNTSASGNTVASGDSAGDQGGIGPAGGLVRAEEHGTVKDATELLSHERANLAPNVKRLVFQHVLMDGNNNSDFFRVNVLVFPRNLSRRLNALGVGRGLANEP